MGPALERHYQFALWLIPTLEKMPRAQKFLLGDMRRYEFTARSLDETGRLVGGWLKADAAAQVPTNQQIRRL